MIRNKNEGFSLVEVLVCVALLAIIIIPIMNAFRTSSRLNYQAHKTQAATEEGQNISEQFKSNSLETMKSLYDTVDVSGNKLGTYVSSWPTPTFDPLVDCGEFPQESFQIWSFYRENVKSENGDIYDTEVVLDPNPYSNTTVSGNDASDTNTQGLPQIENIDAVRNPVIASELNRYDIAAQEVVGAISTKEILVTLERSPLATGSLSVTCDTQYTGVRGTVLYNVYTGNFVLSVKDGTWETGGDLYLFASAYTSGNDQIRIVNRYTDASNPPINVHLIRGGMMGANNFGRIILSDGSTTTMYLNIGAGGTEAQKQPTGSANLYNMKFTTNIRAAEDATGTKINQTSVLTANDVNAGEYSEVASLRCYKITVNLYRPGTITAYNGLTPTEKTTAMSTRMKDQLYGTIVSTKGVN